MSDNEKLKLACETLKQVITNAKLERDFKSKWLELKKQKYLQRGKA